MSPVHATVRIELLGGLRVLVGERTVTRFRTQKTGAVLAYLAFHRGRSHPRDVLAEMFWPEQRAGAGRSSLRQALTSLRKQLEPPGVAAGSVIVSDTATVSLRESHVATDLHELGAELAEAAKAANAERQALHLRRAVELYRGDLLPGHPEDWVLPERDRLRAKFVRATHELVELATRKGDLGGAVELGRRAIAAAPLSEEARRDLMRALALAGEPAEALRELEALEAILARDLGSEPTPATRALARAIMDGRVGQKPFAPTSGPGELPTVPSRSARIETLLVAERVEATAGPLDALARPLLGEGRVLSATAGRVEIAWEHPLDAVAFARALLENDRGGPSFTLAVATGEPGPALRERAVALVLAGHAGQALLTEETAALVRRELAPRELERLGSYRLGGDATDERVHLLRPPGLEGRAFPPLRASPARPRRLPLPFTRFFGREAELARLDALLASPSNRIVTVIGPAGAGKSRLAIESARRAFESRGTSVFFAALADVREAEHLPGALLGAIDEPSSSSEPPLERTVRVLLEERALLLLDNAEHLVDALVPIVRELLERLPRLTIVATSRTRLGLSGERELPLDPLPLPDADAPPEELARCPSVALFVDRATGMRPDFQVTQANARSIAELCRRLDGIPLAYELAAGCTALLTPAQSLALLDARLDVLVARKRDASARHRSLRAAFDVSFELLSSELRRFFAAVSVFAGSFAAEAAAAICEDPEAAEELERLRELSLVVGEDGAEPRYRLLETLREYAREQLSPGERDRLARRHADHFLALAERAEPELQGPSAGEWLDRLTHEQPELHAAIASSLEGAERANVALRIAKAIRPLFWARGQLREGLAVLEAVLARTSGTSHERMLTLNSAGTAAYSLRELEPARRHLEAAVAAARALSDRVWEARFLTSLASLAHGQGELERADRLFESVLAIVSETGDAQAEAWTLQNRAVLIEARGDLRGARVQLERAIAAAKRMGDGVSATAAELGAKQRLGGLVRALGEPENARALLEDVLAGEERLRQTGGVGTAHLYLGELELEEGTLERARSHLERGVAELRSAELTAEVAIGLAFLAHVAVAEAGLTEARALADEAVSTTRKLGAGALIAHALVARAAVARAEGVLGPARDDLLEALRLELADTDRLASIGTLEAIARLDVEEEHLLHAVRLLGATGALRAAQGTPGSRRNRALRDELEHALRARLGDAAFTAVRDAGAALSWEGAMALGSEARG
jgi:predicted ATPase/DNA-binding SARP family transcriptional activator